MSDFNTLNEAVVKGDIKAATAETQKLVDASTKIKDIVDNGLVAAMDTVGDRFAKGQIFVPQMLRSAKTMQECMNVLKPHFQEGDVTVKGRVIMGTVKGDLHDIGKNLVNMMLEGAGFEINDLGVDVPPDRFVQKIKELGDGKFLLGMSALLSITMPAMPETIKAIEAAGLRDQVAIIVGGAPVTEKYATDIGADGYASDAATAVDQAKKLLGIN
jgi:5-methyltetrahydrofolate--homocysteine methyltransferase